MKYLYISIVALLLMACKSENAAEIASEVQQDDKGIFLTNAQFDGEAMTLGSLGIYEFNQTISANGMIDVPPQNKANITTFMGGYIKNTPLLVGDKVKKGQPLVALEHTDFVEIQQNYLEVSEQLSYLKAEQQRQKRLWEENITSEKNFLKAESTYKSQLAVYNGLKTTLEMLHINLKNVAQGIFSPAITLYAPIDGYVTKVNVSNGSYVSPKDIILEIVNTDHIHLELSVFEKDILQVKIGQPIQFKIPEASDKNYEAEVYLVGTTIDNLNRRVNIHGHLKNENVNFIVGMYVEAQIVSESLKSAGLPNTAIAESDDNWYAFKLKNKDTAGYYFEKIKVEKGKQNEGFFEVLNPDDFDGAQILTQGASALLTE